MGELLNEPAFKAVLQNKELTGIVWGILQTNVDDLTNYLTTGKSKTYDGETILGRWDFNVNTTLAMFRQTQPNIPASEMKTVRALWVKSYVNTTFVAGGDGQAFLKSLPSFKKQPPVIETWKGSWSGDGTKYDLSLSGNGETRSMTAQTGGTRLTIIDGKNTWIFDRED
jgi:hypothetical protein